MFHFVDLTPPLRHVRRTLERAYFRYHIKRAGGNITLVAKRTGMERTNLYRKFEQLGIKT